MNPILWLTAMELRKGQVTTEKLDFVHICTCIVYFFWYEYESSPYDFFHMLEDHWILSMVKMLSSMHII